MGKGLLLKERNKKWSSQIRKEGERVCNTT